MTAEDIRHSQELLSQFGCPLDSKELRRRYGSMMGTADDALLVAEDGGRVIALCHAHARPALDKPPEAVARSLVADQAYDDRGVGRDTMMMPETWTSDHGSGSLALYSGAERSEAHAF